MIGVSEGPLQRFPWLPKVLPWALVLFALGFRLMGIGWGLPTADRYHSLHPDEEVILRYSQQINPAGLDFDPGFYNYGTLYLTLLKVTSDVVTAYGGGPDPRQPASVAAYVARLHMGGRVLSAVAGAAMVLFVFWICRRWLDFWPSISGAAVVAAAPGLVVHSRFQTVDVVAAFFLVVSAHFSLRLIPDANREEAHPARLALLSGFFAGLSAGVKYTGVFVMLCLFAAVFYRPRPERLRLIVTGGAAALIAFVLTTPGILTNTGKFLEDFRYEMAHTSTGHGLIFTNTLPGYLFHLENLTVAMGPILAAMGLVGLLGGVWKRQPWAVALGLFFLAYFVLIGRAEVKFLRYVFPLIPVLAVGFAYAMQAAHRRGGVARLGVVIGIFGLFGVDPGGGLRSAATMTGWMAGEDPRDIAGKRLRDLAAERPIRVGLASDPWFYTATLYPEVGAMRPFYSSALRARNPEYRQPLDFMTAARRPEVVLYLPPLIDDRYSWDVRLLEELAPDYVVISSFEAADPARLANATNLTGPEKLQVDRAKAFRDRLTQDYEVAYRDGGGGPAIHDMHYIRPEIWTWVRKTTR